MTCPPAPPHDVPYDRLGPIVPESPVILSVPHAGRDYTPALRAALRAPLPALAILEDRFVDRIATAALGREIALIQRTPRAWIDLNRAEDERDPKLEDLDPGRRPPETAKIRSGLGLVPRRTPSLGDIWRRKLSGAEIDARIVAAHRPYHAALTQALEAARARFGVAVLLDLHSMPPLASGARIVVGDRFGRSANSRFVARVETEAARAGVSLVLNVPYAGGHILATHGQPARGIHAIQIELDRSLYLDRKLDQPGHGMASIVGLVRAMLDALADEAIGANDALAAE